MVLAARAKINLFLRVLAREADGFHGIETLFCLTDLADQLTIERTADGIELEVSGADLGPPEDNLAWRAARSALDSIGTPFGVKITLEKKIPARAGLGGGSADAAAVLDGVNRLAGNAVPRHELLLLGSKLGSDVPFFLLGVGLALGWGHGQRLLRLPPLPARPGLLLIPPEGISTPEAYGWVDEARRGLTPRGPVGLTTAALSDWSDVARMAGNDFESPVFGRRADVREGFEALAATNPMICRLSGSGSSLFAIYRTERERDGAALQLGSRHGKAVPFIAGE